MKSSVSYIKLDGDLNLSQIIILTFQNKKKI